MRNSIKIVAFAVATGLLPAAAFAVQDSPDRLPTKAEQQSIERVLTANGFVAWDEIELDDGRRWEVDDARTADGQIFDVKLAPETLRIIRRSRDN